MKFIQLLSNLKEEYKDDCIIRKNGTLLMHPGRIPNAKHYLFRPLNDELINEFLINQYKNTFPKEYIDFLKFSNGANLFGICVKTPKFTLAETLLTIYGLPRTAPFSRAQDMEEPFDVRIEDLARHDDIPNYWLKCATHIIPDNLDKHIDVFIDTTTGKIYSCFKNTKEIINSWKSLDECFCCLFDLTRKFRDEYDYMPNY